MFIVCAILSSRQAARAFVLVRIRRETFGLLRALYTTYSAFVARYIPFHNFRGSPWCKLFSFSFPLPSVLSPHMRFCFCFFNLIPYLILYICFDRSDWPVQHWGPSSDVMVTHCVPSFPWCSKHRLSFYPCGLVRVIRSYPQSVRTNTIFQKYTYIPNLS